MAKATEFSLRNLRLLDFGKIEVAFKKEVERVVHDCIDRPGDDHARCVVLKFNFAPKIDESMGGGNDCDLVAVECEIQSTVPKRRTKIYDMRPHATGQLSFNPDLPDEPDGETLYDEDERKDDKTR